MNRTQIINNTLKEFRQNVPDYVGCGFVDMSTGMLLAVDTVDDHPREILDIVAAATADLFDGKSITQIEELWKESRGVTEGGHYFKEILVNSDNLVHLFMRSVANQDIAAVVICTRKVSIGMLFAQARQVMREFEAARLSHNVCRIRSSRGPEPANRPESQMRPAIAILTPAAIAARIEAWAAPAGDALLLCRLRPYRQAGFDGLAEPE